MSKVKTEAAPTPRPGAPDLIIAPSGFGEWDTWLTLEPGVVQVARTFGTLAQALIALESEQGAPLDPTSGTGARVFFPLAQDWVTKVQDADQVWACRQWLVPPRVFQGDPQGRHPGAARGNAVAAALALTSQGGDQTRGRAWIAMVLAGQAGLVDGLPLGLREADADAGEVYGYALRNLISGSDGARAVSRAVADALALGPEFAESFPPAPVATLLHYQTWRRLARTAADLGLSALAPAGSPSVLGSQSRFLAAVRAVARVRDWGLGADQAGDAPVLAWSAPRFDGRTVWIPIGEDAGDDCGVFVLADDRTVIVDVRTPGIRASITRRDGRDFDVALAAAQAAADAVRVAQSVHEALRFDEFRTFVLDAFDQSERKGPRDADVRRAGEALLAAAGITRADQPAHRYWSTDWPTPAPAAR